MALLGPQADQVQILFMTLDPQRDTQELLANYVPAPDTAESEEFQVVLTLLTRSLAEDNTRWTNIAAGIMGVTEETTTGVHRL